MHNLLCGHSLHSQAPRMWHTCLHHHALLACKVLVKAQQAWHEELHGRGRRLAGISTHHARKVWTGSPPPMLPAHRTQPTSLHDCCMRSAALPPLSHLQ